jgi:hypothetical protein
MVCEKDSHIQEVHFGKSAEPDQQKLSALDYVPSGRKAKKTYKRITAIS